MSEVKEKLDQKTVLHVGCGELNPEKLHSSFRDKNYREIRLDIDPNVTPDILTDMVDMHMIEDSSHDALYSSHNLEHVYPHEVVPVLKEFYRVIRPGGHILITMPDIQSVAKFVAEGNLEGALYNSPAGDICAIDIMYGLRRAISEGHHHMAHKTAFTEKTLRRKLEQAGYKDIRTERVTRSFNLWAMAFK